MCGSVSSVDVEARCITVDGRRLRYDALVLATGASHSYFGNEHWSAYAPGLKSIEDATSIRGRILSAFERAEARALIYESVLALAGVDSISAEEESLMGWLQEAWEIRGSLVVNSEWRSALFSFVR